ncbi:MAG: TetR/AcrR family transcriptional regulator [Bacteroidales bacterium]|nr:TetR/AcrR family transcriptional regulator [Bacteroidales bacterium]MBD5211638.1 TetR/AcrR family transcriptional regulator [Bacteroidales bacterium]MBD5216992.1 TetR/AcrR family transcriptional regulator [Bacteroidales bacterium]
MVRKTRDKFIEVARQLFARKGVENTTMNDIASASDKGRRTIYTYFKSKREIFNAVIESETDELLERLRYIVSKNIAPEEKLYEYVECRFETMREIVKRNGSLRAGFFRDVRKVERARKLLTAKETDLLSDILREGQQMGIFDIDDVRRLSIVIVYALNGLDVPYINDSLADKGVDKSILKDYISELIIYGIKKR